MKERIRSPARRGQLRSPALGPRCPLTAWPLLGAIRRPPRLCSVAFGQGRKGCYACPGGGSLGRSRLKLNAFSFGSAVGFLTRESKYSCGSGGLEAVEFPSLFSKAFEGCETINCLLQAEPFWFRTGTALWSQSTSPGRFQVGCNWLTLPKEKEQKWPALAIPTHSNCLCSRKHRAKQLRLLCFPFS